MHLFYNASTILEPSNNHRHIWNTGGRRNRLPNERKPRSQPTTHCTPYSQRPVVDRHKQRIHNHIRLRHKFNRVQLTRYVDATYTTGKALTLVGYGSEQEIFRRGRSCQSQTRTASPAGQWWIDSPPRHAGGEL
jgi:hypothetical protein